MRHSLTCQFFVGHTFAQKLKNKLKVLAVDVALPIRDRYRLNLLFDVEHRKRMHKVVFGSFWVGARLADYFDELLKFKRRPTVWEFSHRRCIDCLLWELRLVLGP
jgi:hypothetical protein